PNRWTAKLISRLAVRLSGPTGSGILTDMVDLVGNQPVCFAVDRVSGLRVGCLDQAEDLARGLVHPVRAVVDAVLALRRDIRLVSTGHVGRRHSAFDVV